MASEHTVGFEPADRLAQDRESVRRRFWIKLKRVVAQLPFAEDLLAAYYCAFDKQTPRHVQAALLGAIAYFILPFDFIPDMLPVLGFTDDAAVLATAIRLVASHITPEHRDAARAALKRARQRRHERCRDTEAAATTLGSIARQIRSKTATLSPRLSLDGCADFRRARTCAWRVLLGLPGLELLEQALPCRRRTGSFAAAGLCFRNSSNLSRATGSMPCWSSHCLAAGKRCQSGKRRRQRHLLPFRMERRILEGRETS